MSPDPAETLNLDGPLLVFGGPYSNLQATRAMRTIAARLGIGPENTLCTGDIVAYCADAAATVNEIRDWGCHVVMGNCEEQLAESAPDCGCGFDEGTSCDLLSKQWYDHADGEIDAEARAWMAALPQQIELNIAGLKALAIHGGVTSINRFVFAGSDDTIFNEELAATDAELIIGGHAGIPFTKQIGNRTWHNAGVIGMPANDGTKDTWYSLLTPTDDGLKIAHHRLQYDWQAAQSAMKQVGLDSPYAEALGTGLWPPTDILPETEKAAQGRPIFEAFIDA